jgi:hypothetical protein
MTICASLLRISLDEYCPAVCRPVFAIDEANFPGLEIRAKKSATQIQEYAATR